MRYKLNEPKMLADITEGTAIIINSVTGIYYGINYFGTAIYENLLSGSTVDDINLAVASLPGVPEGTEDKIRAFIDKLIDFEILVPDDSLSTRPATIDPVIAQADSFTPGCKDYKDIQELLFADPIHEVDADEGWRPEK
ncbi:MAG: hypothetical protein IKW99_05620 [Bacteroidales bacterium]|nr:hypothetical protein [Bacteroidales bacterium]